jgi:phage-related protein
MEGGDGVSSAFDAMGMDFERIQGFIASGDEAWGDYVPQIVDGLMNIDNAVERNAAGVAIFGTKWEDIGGDIFMAAGQATDAIGDISGATDEAAAVASQGIGPAWERLKRTAIDALAPLGDELGNLVDQAIPYVEQLAVWIGENAPVAIQFLRDTWNETWPQVQAALQAAWTFLQPIFQRIVGFFQSEGPSALSTLQAIWAAVWPQIQAVAQTVLGEVVPFIQSQFQVVVDWVQTNWPLIQETVATIMAAIQAVISGVMAAITAFWNRYGDQIVQAWMRNWEMVKTIVSTVIQAVLGVIRAVMQMITGDWRGALDTLRQTAETIWNGIRRVVSLAIQNVQTVIRATLGVIRAVWGAIWNGIQARVTAIWNGIVSAVSGKIQEVRSSVQNGINAVRSFLSGVSLAGIGRAMIGGLVAGVRGAVGGLVSAARDAVTSALNAARAALGISSPSQEFIKVAQFAMEGLSVGFDQFSDRPAQTLASNMRGMAQPGLIPSFAGAGGGGGVVNVYFGRDSVRSDRDIDEIMERLQRMLQLRGIRRFEVD